MIDKEQEHRKSEGDGERLDRDHQSVKVADTSKAVSRELNRVADGFGGGGLIRSRGGQFEASLIGERVSSKDRMVRPLECLERLERSCVA